MQRLIVLLSKSPANGSKPDGKKRYSNAYSLKPMYATPEQFFK